MVYLVCYRVNDEDYYDFFSSYDSAIHHIKELRSKYDDVSIEMFFSERLFTRKF